MCENSARGRFEYETLVVVYGTFLKSWVNMFAQACCHRASINMATRNNTNVKTPRFVRRAQRHYYSTRRKRSIF
ncbi:hypothetical protein VFPBJ_10014 [Purpureocillium lilacinum]|uniref:Uncharacterized protein n=1 Tax=Purpureocillium lilacinum TaxID=33203 RepID=A0A179GC65_PURLI|nr:hypothetical protein VFPBJ_10014 [Purpureocillium lilacinum]